MRIGQPRNNSIRLIKVNMKHKNRRDAVIEKSPRLKTKTPPWNKVYVKKDVHPVYSKENSRLYKKMMSLRTANEGKEIKLVKGALHVDGKVVDKNLFFV